MEQETASNVLARISTAMKRHHDHSNSYKEEHLTEEVAHSYRASVHYHPSGTWPYAGRHDAGEVAESSAFADNRKRTETLGATLSLQET